MPFIVYELLAVILGVRHRLQTLEHGAMSLLPEATTKRLKRSLSMCKGMQCMYVKTHNTIRDQDSVHREATSLKLSLVMPLFLKTTVSFYSLYFVLYYSQSLMEVTDLSTYGRSQGQNPSKLFLSRRTVTHD